MTPELQLWPRADVSRKNEMNLVKTLKRQDPVEPIKVDARANGIHLRIGSPGEFLAGVQV